MKTILYDNSSKSLHDKQVVLNELFDAIFNGKDFKFISDEGDGDIFTLTYQRMSTDYTKLSGTDLFKSMGLDDSDLFKQLGDILKPKP